MNDLPVVLVTGASSGIGAATAELLAARGWHVVAAGRDLDRLKAVAARADGVVETVVMDVGDAGRVDVVVRDLQHRLGRLDAVVLGAGIAEGAPVGELPDQLWRDVLTTNLDGAMHVARACLPVLEAGGHGALVALSSIAARAASVGGVAYSASKAALIMLMATIAVEYGRRGVRANTVSPGWISSEMSDRDMAAVAEEKGITAEQAYALAAAHVPQGRVGEPREIAEVIAWLISPSASYINGAVIAADGGLGVVDPGMLAL